MDLIEKTQLDEQIISEHWYYESKYQLVKQHLQSLPLELNSFRIADVGTGLGFFLHKLELDGFASPLRSIGVDIGYSNPANVINSNIVIYPHFPYTNKYNTILLMDVLEHVKNDAAFLEDVISHLSRHGYILITVPAFPLLWSGHDRYLGHYRRYTISTLKNLIAGTGTMEILSLHYYFASVLPLALPIRLMRSFVKQPDASDMQALPSTINWFLKKICYLELKVSNKNVFAGLSVVALCKKSI